jgi:hypothetical protein
MYIALIAIAFVMTLMYRFPRITKDDRLSNMGSTSQRLDLDNLADAEGCKMYPRRDLRNKGE